MRSCGALAIASAAPPPRGAAVAPSAGGDRCLRRADPQRSSSSRLTNPDQLTSPQVIGDILQPTHLLFILVVALIVLGPKRLPEVGRSLGRGLRDFRSAISGQDEEQPPETVQHLQSGEGQIAAQEQAPAAQPQPEPTAVSAAQSAAPQEPASVSAEQRSTDSA